MIDSPETKTYLINCAACLYPTEHELHGAKSARCTVCNTMRKLIWNGLTYVSVGTA